MKMSQRILKTRAEMFRQKIEEALGMGLDRLQASAHVGVSGQTLTRYAEVLGIRQWPRKKRERPQEMKERNAEIMRMRKEGATLEEIGAHFKITRERVRQLLMRHGGDEVPPARISYRTARLCNGCGMMFTPEHNHQTYCNRMCRSLSSMKEGVITRDKAIEIMRLRDLGFTWDDVSDRIVPGANRGSFRASLQRQIPILFSSDEQRHYFPPRNHKGRRSL